jgi:hypothetical protein
LSRSHATDVDITDNRRKSHAAAAQNARDNAYAPVKRYLELLGFTVKGEVCGCDLVALCEKEPPIVVIGELKLAFSLELMLQGVDRSAASDEVWLR